MKKFVFPILLVVSLVAAACGAQLDTSETEPTAETVVITADEEESAQDEFPAELAAQLDAFLASQVYSEGGYPMGAAPGLVLLVDTPEGRYLKAAGVASLEDATPMLVDDILEIGSNTKSMVITVMMQLQEEGLLSFDDKLTDWLPELAARIPNGEQVDLRMMANMATGFWDYSDSIIGEGANSREAMRKAYTPGELIEYAIENGTPDFLPGEGFNYSNTNYILLGMIAEKASGQSLVQLFQERIFDPLGMETAVLIEDVPQEGQIITQGYWWEEDGTRLNTTEWNASQGWAAGANAMSAEDLLAYGKALGAGELFQDPDSLAQMLPYNDGSLFSLGGAYGLGLLDFGQGYWGHGGQSLGFQSLWYTNPDKGVTVVGLTNSAAYEAWHFVSVIDILEGRGLRPLQYGSLLPIAEAFPVPVVSNWIWKGQGSMEDLEANPDLIALLGLGPDGSAKLTNPVCGTVEGTYTTTQDLEISFGLEADDSLTCPEGAPLLQLLDLLGSAESWRFDNGRLVISLADDAGELIFEPLSL